MNHPYRPKTGRYSVPFPKFPPGSDPGDSKFDHVWAGYHRRQREAEAVETADEAVERCRGEACDFDGGSDRFDAVLNLVLHTFDTRGEYIGLSLDESSYYSSWMIDNLSRAWSEMSRAFDGGDRDSYRKAAAEFSRAISDLSIDLRAKAEQGGAA